MQNESLLAAIERHEAQADSYGGSSNDRSLAIDYYHGRPMGNEVDGRSQVVSRDVYDTVEWIKPQIADVFCSGDEVVSFAPKGPDDVAKAQQETEYVNYIATEKNAWFEVFTNWAHDALLQRNGYVIAYWDDHEDRTKEKYKGLSADELVMLAQDPSVSIVAGDVNEDGSYTVELERAEGYSCVKFEGVPPERVLVSPNARGLCLQDPRLDFCEYWEYKTISDLRDEGFDVTDDLQDHSEITQDWEEASRDDDNPFRNHEGEESSPAARRLKTRNVWIRFDSNDDGLTELRRVVVVGTTILLDEECDEVTLVALCPIMLPHQHVGLSVADAVTDLQKIKTALLRGALDNVYLANNGRHAVNVDRVNLDDMLVSRPGGVVRVEGPPSDAIFPLTHSTTGDVAIPMLEYVDRIAQKRTGVSEAMQGLNPNALNNSMGAQTNMAMVTAAQQRIKFIARTFAETGVKQLFRIIHALSLKHARKAEIVRLRNQWVEIDPREWKKRMDLTVSVGLGSGDRPQQIMMLQQILGIQAQAAPFGLTSPPKIFNTLKRLVKAAGFKDELEFWDDPATTPPKPPQTPPEVLKEQAKAQAQGQIKMLELQAAEQQQMREHALKMREIEANLMLQQSNDMRDSERERLKLHIDQQLEAERRNLEAWKAELQAQVTRETTTQDNQTKLIIAGQQAEQATTSEAIKVGHDAMQKDAERKFVKDEREAQQKPQKDMAADAKQTLAQVTAALSQLTEMQRKIVDGQQSLEKAIRAKRVLKRDEAGRPSHSEIEDGNP